MPPKFYRKKAATNKPISSANYTDIKGEHAHAMYLVIVESPSKCAKIENYLGPDYRCIASKGHIRAIDVLKI